jgi:hypothetical protein
MSDSVFWACFMVLWFASSLAAGMILGKIFKQFV